MADQKFFFVCGAPKSGTTWLQRVLDAHPEVHCSGEGHFIDRLTLPIAGVFRDYVSHMKLVSTGVYEGEPYYPAVTQLDFDGIIRAFILCRLSARQPGSEVRWIGDKTPRYTRSLAKLLRLFPDARFINIVRDPRDVALSRLHHAKRAAMDQAKVPVTDIGTPERTNFIREGGIDWTRDVEPIEIFAQAHPGRLHSLRYEDMIADPAWEARRLFGFLGVSSASDLIADIVARTSFETLSGRKPGEEHPTSFLRKGIAGDWREGLEAEGQQALEEVCGPLMRQHGYM